MTEDSDNIVSNEHTNERTDEQNIDQDLYLNDSDHTSWTSSSPMAELPSEVFKKNLLPADSRKFILQNEPKNRNISFTPPDMNRKAIISRKTSQTAALKTARVQLNNLYGHGGWRSWFTSRPMVRMFGECWATSIIREGYIPEWSATPPLKQTPISQRRYGNADLNMFSHEISELLKIKAIQEMDPEEPCFVSNLFMVPKKEKITATTDGVFPARLHSRILLKDKNISLKMQGWNGIIELSLESIAQLEWWIKNLPLWNRRSLIPEKPKTILYTDVSTSGWVCPRRIM
ncbi:hypothetical protein C1646_796187 [Rhizophagus diaphanus]|nr:hypothetical protein C1646_796187 [Rhizophagus diaphanus] [Rhizophagus sp. MUCL 43196]